MLKIIGSILILGACTGLGFEKAHEIQLHRQQLGELKRIFTLIRSELQYHKIIFSELFYRVGKKTDGVWNQWLTGLSEELERSQSRTFYEIWRVSVEQSLACTVITEKEKDELLTLGNSLGCPEAVDLYLEQLEFHMQKTKEEEQNKKKLYQSMGILGGLFLVIMLF